jgi:hypothetical protein
MNFTSQICTTREQSKRLLDLGVKAETADMYHYVTSNGTGISAMDDNFLPHMDTLAWSLHRLIEMCPLIPNPSRFLAVTSFKTVYVRMNNEIDVTYAGKGTYDNLINCIQWLIAEGYFNKKYLED